MFWSYTKELLDQLKVYCNFCVYVIYKWGMQESVSFFKQNAFIYLFF